MKNSPAEISASRCRLLPAVVVATGFFVASFAGAAAAAGGYQLAETWPLSGALKWDYLSFDPGSHHLFISHGDHVDVIDTVTKKSAGSIDGTDGVHGIALAPDLGRGFTSNGKANTVTIFDLATLKTLGTAPTGKKPDAIIYDPASKHVFAANGQSDSLTVIDAAAGKTIGEIKLTGGPESAVVDGKGRLYIDIEDKSQIDVVDTQKAEVTAQYDVSAVCDEPAGLSLDRAQGRLFATCHNQKMAVVDASNGKILADLPIGKGTDYSVFDAGAGLAFSSNGDGSLTVVGSDGKGGYAVQQVVKTLPGARTMALDETTHTIYLVTGNQDGTEPATPDHPHPRPHYKDGSFKLLAVKADNAGK